MGLKKWLSMSSEERFAAKMARKKRINANNELFRLIVQKQLADDSYEIVKSAINSGADVNTVGGEGNTLLHCAAMNGCPKVARLLIEHGADVEAGFQLFPDSTGTTPLMMAAQFGHIAVATLLLEAGADTHKIVAFGNDCFLPQLSKVVWVSKIQVLLFAAGLMVAVHESVAETNGAIIRFTYSGNEAMLIVDAPEAGDYTLQHAHSLTNTDWQDTGFFRVIYTTNETTLAGSNDFMDYMKPYDRDTFTPNYEYWKYAFADVIRWVHKDGELHSIDAFEQNQHLYPKEYNTKTHAQIAHMKAWVDVDPANRIGLVLVGHPYVYTQRPNADHPMFYRYHYDTEPPYGEGEDYPDTISYSGSSVWRFQRQLKGSL
ncbi:ankyrin repeat domain-containing protein [Pontiella sulfatireligans]|nr:ankyrin repeat domain-containing protein [Pontiella sulfatireligans]